MLYQLSYEDMVETQGIEPQPLVLQTSVTDHLHQVSIVAPLRFELKLHQSK